jgi:molecular chaperone DnaK
MADNDPARINSATDRLTTASHKLAEAMYKTAGQPGAQQAPPEQAGGGDGKKGKDDVVDAEFVDVDDKKK